MSKKGWGTPAFSPNYQMESSPQFHIRHHSLEVSNAVDFTQNDANRLRVGLPWRTEPAPDIYSLRGQQLQYPMEEQPSPGQFLLPGAVATGEMPRQFCTDVLPPIFSLLMLPS